MDQRTIRQTWLSRKLNPSAATVAALATLALALGSVMYWNNSFSAEGWMTASHAQVISNHEWWRAWTTLFVHENLRHLLSNAFLFFIVGTFLAGYFGVFVFPVAAFLTGGVTNWLVLRGMPDEVRLIGASGIVFWMGGCWLTLYFFLDRRKTLGQRALRAFGVALGLFMPAEAFDPSISYETHLVGFVGGVAFALIFYVLQRGKFRAAEVVEVELESEEIDEDLPGMAETPALPRGSASI